MARAFGKDAAVDWLDADIMTCEPEDDLNSSNSSASNEEATSFSRFFNIPDDVMHGSQETYDYQRMDKEMPWDYIIQLEENVTRLERDIVLLRGQVDDLEEFRHDDGERARLRQEIRELRDQLASRTDACSPSPQVSRSASPTSSATQPRPRSRHNSDSQSRRKYVRRPKRDTNAPPKPLTAYASFANDLRRQSVDQNLSFTEQAKFAGVKWQSCPDNLRDLYLGNAMAEKHQYETELAKYRATDAYKRYQEYIAKFKVAKGKGMETF